MVLLIDSYIKIVCNITYTKLEYMNLKIDLKIKNKNNKMPNFKRIEKEILDVEKLNFYEITRLNECKYRVIFNGPEDSPYENIRIVMYYYFPEHYPFQAPTIYFQPHLFHPNVNFQGFLIVDTLTGKGFSPALSMHAILTTILSLLYEPYICEDQLPVNDKGKEELNTVNDLAVNMEALNLWQSDPLHFSSLVRLSAE